MCPACIASATLLAAGTASAGGLAALIVTKLRPKPQSMPRHATPEKEDAECP